MLRRMMDNLRRKERKFRNSFGHDITTPHERRKSRFHVNWLDHGILRSFWHNFSLVAPGVYRSNHPDHSRFAAYKARGIKTVLNLRGAAQQPHYLFEQESCDKLGLTLVDLKLSARQAPPREMLLKVIDTFGTMEKPVLIHCKSGADRTGLVAALYLMICENRPLDEALDQLSFRYLHIRRSATGILDHFFETYRARNAHAPIGIVDWIRDEYDAEALTASFKARQAALKPWQGW